MKFAKVINGVVDEYKEFDSQPECKIIAGLPTIRPVVELTKPGFDPITQRLDKVVTIFDDRVEWAWTAVALSLEQVAANQRVQADEQLKTTMKADTFVQQFVGMSLSEVGTYVDGLGFADPVAKQFCKRLAQMVLLLAKHEYRE